MMATHTRMDSSYTICIARDFHFNPIGRFPEDGPHSGERFRKEFLVPALRQYQNVVVDLDDVLGLGSSFLEEAFGGLVRLERFSSKELLGKLEIVGGVASERDAVWQFIHDAKPKRG